MEIENLYQKEEAGVVDEEPVCAPPRRRPQPLSRFDAKVPGEEQYGLTFHTPCRVKGANMPWVNLNDCISWPNSRIELKIEPHIPRSLVHCVLYFFLFF